MGGVAEGFCAAVELSDSEREQLLQLCRQRLDAFRMQRGEEVGCLLTQKPAASGTGAATAPRSAARSKSGCSPVPRAAANAAGPMSIKGPWRWTTSCPGTRAARTTSATCRPSASAAMPASAMQFTYARGHHRLPRAAGQLHPSPGQLCVLRAGGQRPGAAGERTGAVHRRCLSGDAWALPGDPAAACGRWVGIAPARMERSGGAAEAAAGAAERPGSVDQRLECGVELR